jgi:3-deoxy-7-phosphoheptulonate synthase
MALGDDRRRTGVQLKEMALSHYDPYGSGTRLLEARGSTLRGLVHTPAAQQPSWGYHAELPSVRADLAERPGLVDGDGILALRAGLARVEAGDAYLLHVGECAELFSMAEPALVERRVSFYLGLADHLAALTGREVVLLARMAGQHAKPRSQSAETLPNGRQIPAYRGDAVNDLTPSVVGRQPDPRRLLLSYAHSRATLEQVRGRVFVSHEALLRDYEEPLTRGPHASSAHLVWIGDRTRRLWNWHVQWARLIANPVGVKLGPTASPSDAIELVRALNPRREVGRLSLITRMGSAAAASRLAALTRALGPSGSPVLWQCDPMHGNTRKLPGVKVRLLPDVRAEVTTFVRTLRAAGCHPGGLHLEVTPEDVSECYESTSAAAGQTSTPPCDPRLNPSQAMDVVTHFANALRQ